MRPFRFLALGDSYTIGEAVPSSARWPEQLVERLRAEGIELSAPLIVAKTGWTTDELDGAIDGAAISGDFDLVTLLIGVNNQYRGRDAAEYRHQFAHLLRRAIGFAAGHAERVIVVSIPDWGVTPFARQHDRDPARVGSEIDLFNLINHEETERAGAHYVDITPGSRDAATDTTLLAGDGLHPSAKMYQQWTAAILPVAKQILARN